MDREDLFAAQNQNVDSSDDDENVTVDENKINYYKNFNIGTKDLSTEIAASKNLQLFPQIVLISGNMKYFIAEEEALQLGLGLMNVPYSKVKINATQISAGELPLLRVNDRYLTRTQFVDFVLSIQESFLKCVKQKTENKGHLLVSHAIVLCREELQRVTSYFSWIRPPRHYKYRDPYWLLINPIKKFEHYFHLKQLQHTLGQNGITSENTAILKATSVLNKIHGLVRERNKIDSVDPSDDLVLVLFDIVVYSYIKQIYANTPDSILAALIGREFKDIKHLYDKYDLNKEELIIRFRATAAYQLTFGDTTVKNQDKSRAKTPKEEEREKYNNLFLGAVSMSTFLFLYHYFKQVVVVCVRGHERCSNQNNNNKKICEKKRVELIVIYLMKRFLQLNEEHVD
eukprot:TRINITY_DN9424_c0_g1_i1.p1 TRINITY_DN9424_c0_g1~~TRINITY_DN9424_c0_g1_i1.p1  ORF type:complete len:400 (+),score=77.12 TRINITY_DN9424_c0_g1_i1:25-1224(+)